MPSPLASMIARASLGGLGFRNMLRQRGPPGALLRCRDGDAAEQMLHQRLCEVALRQHIVTMQFCSGRFASMSVL